MHFHSIPHKHVRVQQKDHNLKNEKFTYNFSLPKTSNNTLRKSAVSFCCVHFVSTSIDLMWSKYTVNIDATEYIYNHLH